MSMTYNNYFEKQVISLLDFKKKYPTVPKVIIGESHTGIWNPKLSEIMIIPKNKIEYIAPFFK